MVMIEIPEIQIYMYALHKQVCMYVQCTHADSCLEGEGPTT